MTREELFRAVGEVREDQIEAAEIVKKQIHPWRRFGALAACLALVVTAAAAPELREADHWKWTAIVKSFNPGAEAGEDPDAGKPPSGRSILGRRIPAAKRRQGAWTAPIIGRTARTGPPIPTIPPAWRSAS